MQGQLPGGWSPAKFASYADVAVPEVVVDVKVETKVDEEPLLAGNVDVHAASARAAHRLSAWALSRDCTMHVFLLLGPVAMGQCVRVCREWKTLAGYLRVCIYCICCMAQRIGQFRGLVAPMVAGIDGCEPPVRDLYFKGMYNRSGTRAVPADFPRCQMRRTLLLCVCVCVKFRV